LGKCFTMIPRAKAFISLAPMASAARRIANTLLAETLVWRLRCVVVCTCTCMCVRACVACVRVCMCV